jgi:hypothetical protein
MTMLGGNRMFIPGSMEVIRGDGGVVGHRVLVGDETTESGGVIPMKSRSTREKSDLKDASKGKSPGPAESWP